MKHSEDDSIRTRPSLIHRLKDWNDQTSWQTFYATYGRLIFNVARQAGLTAPEAEEAVQDTFVQVAKKMPEFRYDPSIGSFKNWLLHTARWKIQDQYRKRAKGVDPPPAPADESRRTSTVERIADPKTLDLERNWNEEWRKNHQRVALERLKRKVHAKQYQIFYLHVIKEQPVEEVMRRLGVSRNTVYVTKCRVLRLFAEELKGLGPD